MVLVSVMACFVNALMFIGVSRRIVDAGWSVASSGVVPDGVIMGFAAVSVYSLVTSFLLILHAIVGSRRSCGSGNRAASHTMI